MKNHSSENYLDQLLNSINDGSDTEPFDSENTIEDLPLEELEREAFEKELFGVPSKDELAALKEEEFLREFEAELLKGDIPDFEILEEDTKEKRASKVEESIDGMLAYMEHIPQVDENAEFEGDLPGVAEPSLLSEEEIETQGLDAAVNAFDGDIENMEPEGFLEVQLTEDGELDLSGHGDDDLMALLAEGGGLSEIGDMLNADENGVGIEETDTFDEFALNEMDEGREEVHKKGKGIGGFFKKLMGSLLGDDEEENVDTDDSLSPKEGINFDNLSEENQQILMELEAAGEVDASADDAKDKDKKKAKKPKKEKPKKEKPKKAPKPKKVKKPKEKDNTPPLPKKPVMAIVIMVASLFGLVMLGTKLMGYQLSVSQAKSLLKEQRYVEAYGKLAGCTIKEKDMTLFQQLETLAPVSSEYNSYLVFSHAKKHDMALDSLICAYGRYSRNRDRAIELECLADLENMGSDIITALLAEFDMTGPEALELYDIRSRKEYTIQLHYKLQELGLE